MRHGELVEKAASLLRDHGFTTAVNRLSPGFCIDIVAKRDEGPLVIKVLEDLASVGREVLEELRIVSSWARASPLVLAEKMGGEELDDDAVYVRNGVFALSPGALRRTLEGDPPLVEVSSTGCFVYVDGDRVRKKREELGLSVGELARLVGVSRMTIYSYEHGRKRTTPSVAYRLAFVLGIPVTVPINPLEARGGRHRRTRLGLFNEPPLKGLLKAVADVLRRLRMAARALARAPFEILASHDMMKLAVNVVHCHSYNRGKIKFTRELAGLTELRQLVVRPSGYECPDDVPSVGLEELRNVRDTSELARLVAS